MLGQVATQLAAVADMLADIAEKSSAALGNKEFAERLRRAVKKLRDVVARISEEICSEAELTAAALLSAAFSAR